jgi:hypothetical protein
MQPFVMSFNRYRNPSSAGKVGYVPKALASGFVGVDVLDEHALPRILESVQKRRLGCNMGVLFGLALFFW